MPGVIRDLQVNQCALPAERHYKCITSLLRYSVTQRYHIGSSCAHVLGSGKSHLTAALDLTSGAQSILIFLALTSAPRGELTLCKCF